jgi:hypothetical protein
MEINSLKILEGSLPRRAKALTIEWAKSHQDELYNNWLKAQQQEMLDKIAPLE